jgi:hypothetical protein
MKKKSIIYFLIPIAALVIFVPFYWNYSTHYEEVMANREAAIQKAKNDELAEQDRLRQKAVQDALDAQAKRQQQKKEREALEAERRQELEDAMAARDKAQSESRTLAEKVDRLKNDVKAVEDEITKIQADESTQRLQEGFVQQSVEKAQANVKNLTQVLEKIAAADQAAEAAREAAAKKS